MKYLLLASLLWGPTVAVAAVSLPDIFSDHAVLQKSSQTALWGAATPGEKITASLGNSAVETTADEKGRWRLALDLSGSEPGPFDLVVKGSNTITSHDVIVGDVWICSGQSNMEFKLSKAIGGPEEIAKSDHPLLRCFLPKRQALPQPADNMEGRWIVASPANSGSFSAVAWYFAKAVQASQHIPLGLIDTSWGGTPAEAWISSEGLDRDAELKARKETILADRPHVDEALRAFPAAFKSWASKYQREDRLAGNAADFTGPEVSATGWKTVSLPGSLAKADLSGSGVIWLRKEIEIPPNRAGTYLPLLLGTLHDFETVYWNGRKIGETTPVSSTSTNPDLSATTNRRYDVPGDQVKPGKNILAIRLHSPAGNAGIDASRFVAGWNIPLSGPWLAKTEYELPTPSAEATSSYPHRPPWPAMPHYTATYLSNGMLRPLTQLSLRGVIWYQGEANTSRAHQYRTTFPLLVQDWREQLHRPDLPFYFCQLANYQAKKSEPADSAWAELREAQAQVLSLPYTGMATLIDLGEEEDIHFRDKKDAGERLAAIALAQTYGQTTPFSGPVYESAEVTEGKVRLHFSHSDGGLVARPLPDTYQPKSSYPATKPLVRNSLESELQGFAICGDDHRWKWAKAKIEGNTVLVWSDEIPNPKFVRYAWADNPTCNFYNGAGFPAAPFRTDSFTDSTVSAKF